MLLGKPMFVIELLLMKTRDRLGESSNLLRIRKSDQHCDIYGYKIVTLGY